ncbi:MAG: hypothetical protein ACRCTI_04100, partial [Beijerinckiaceae bacterium]
MIELRTYQRGQVVEPGFWLMSPDDYHADPCPQPSLSSSGINTILQRSPLHLWREHPKLGAVGDLDSSAAADFGTVAHSMVLGAGREFAVVDADSWRTNDAKKQRDEARARGATPILIEQHQRATDLAANLVESIRECDGAEAFFDPACASEVVAIWRESNGIWCRAMMDRFSLSPIGGLLRIYDLKTTKMPLDAVSLGRHIVASGYDVQSCWYERGVETLCPEMAGRTRFTFVFAEGDHPFCSRAAECGGQMRSTAEQKVLAALSI